MQNEITQHKTLLSRMYRFLEALQSKPFNKKDLEQFYTANALMISW